MGEQYLKREIDNRESKQREREFLVILAYFPTWRGFQLGLTGGVP